MRIVTNPGSNLGRAAVERYGIHLTPQQIVVDGVAHDTRERITADDVDRWIRGAKEFPYLIGTTAPEFVSTFSTLLKDDPELLVVMTSKKVVKSFTAAESASRAMHDTSRHRAARISIVDTGMASVGAGLVTLAVAEAARAGKPLDAVTQLGRALSERSRMIWKMDSLDYARRGGRAGWLRSWLAEMLDVRPIVGFVDGEVKSVGRISPREDAAVALATNLAKGVGPREPVWIGVCHGHASDQADRLIEELRRRLDVLYVWKQAVSSSVYLHSGPGTVGAAVMPVGHVLERPPVPPSFPDEG